jgi:hypothetical protein
MAKRRRSLTPEKGVPAKAAGRQPRLDHVHSSLYLHDAIYEALRQVAFDERRKIHDVVIEGIGLALRKRGFPPIDELKVKWRGKGD